MHDGAPAIYFVDVCRQVVINPKIKGESVENGLCFCYHIFRTLEINGRDIYIGEETKSMMKLYICPDCGWLRLVSRRTEVECHRCGVPQMVAVKLTYSRYARMTEKEREDYVTSWFYIHKRTRKPQPKNRKF